MTASPRSQSRQAEARGRDLAAAYSRLIAALAFARGCLRLDLTARAEAEQVRARLTGLMEPLLDLAASDNELLTVAVGAYGEALAALDARILSLAPLARVVTGESQPVMLLAWQIYGDTTRAAELFRLNSGRCPEFMPTTLLATLPKAAR